MKPERSIKELLIILRDNTHICFFTKYCMGICSVVQVLRGEGIITWDESILLINYIAINGPYGSASCGVYWWPAGELTPRLEWLNQQIEKL